MFSRCTIQKQGLFTVSLVPEISCAYLCGYKIQIRVAFCFAQVITAFEKDILYLGIYSLVCIMQISFKCMMR